MLEDSIKTISELYVSFPFLENVSINKNGEVAIKMQGFAGVYLKNSVSVLEYLESASKEQFPSFSKHVYAPYVCPVCVSDAELKFGHYFCQNKECEEITKVK